jgi:hypothetical protein
VCFSIKIDCGFCKYKCIGSSSEKGHIKRYKMATFMDTMWKNSLILKTEPVMEILYLDALVLC